MIFRAAFGVFAIGVALACGGVASAAPKLGNGFACRWGSDCLSDRCSLSRHICESKDGPLHTKFAAGASCRWGTDCASGDCSLSRHVCVGDAKPAPSGGGQRRPGPSLSGKLIEPETPTACGRDLYDGGYEPDPILGWLNGESDCHYYSAEVIARAKKLKDAGYGANNFSISLAFAEGTPGEIECAKKAWDTMPAAERADDEMPTRVVNRCKGKQPTATTAPPPTTPPPPTPTPTPNRRTVSDSGVTTTTSSGKDVIATIEATGCCAVFLKIVEQTGMTATLRKQANITVFASPDKAFDKPWLDLIERSPQSALRMVKSAVVPELVPLSAFPSGYIDRTNLEGNSVRLRTHADYFTIGYARGALTELHAKNGIVYIVDRMVSR